MSTIQIVGIVAAVAAFIYLIGSKFGWKNILSFFTQSDTDDETDEDVLTIQVTGSELFLAAKVLIGYFEQTGNMEGEMAARTAGQNLFNTQPKPPTLP